MLSCHGAGSEKQRYNFEICLFIQLTFRDSKPRKILQTLFEEDMKDEMEGNLEVRKPSHFYTFSSEIAEIIFHFHHLIFSLLSAI